jgi:hypothetical protein
MATMAAASSNIHSANRASTRPTRHFFQQELAHDYYAL